VIRQSDYAQPRLATLIRGGRRNLSSLLCVIPVDYVVERPKPRPAPRFGLGCLEFKTRQETSRRRCIGDGRCSGSYFRKPNCGMVHRTIAKHFEFVRDLHVDRQTKPDYSVDPWPY
jgi:hypothetical protein